jgi:hypothetical protein
MPSRVCRYFRLARLLLLLLDNQLLLRNLVRRQCQRRKR